MTLTPAPDPSSDPVPHRTVVNGHEVWLATEGDMTWVEVVDLPGCFASGSTLAEVSTALDEAVAFYRA